MERDKHSDEATAGAGPEGLCRGIGCTPEGDTRGHFLSGASLGVLSEVVARYGGIDPEFRKKYRLAKAFVWLRWPWRVVDELLYRWAGQPTGLTEWPVFIVGHWRSGTTHLHYLLARDSQFGVVENHHAVYPWQLLSPITRTKWLLQLFMPPTRPMDEVALTTAAPTEEGIPLANLCPFSFFHCFYFPQQAARIFRESVLGEGNGETRRRWEAAYLRFLGKMSVLWGGKRPLLKDPSHTARLAHLLELFPEARFIHVTRDPIRVVQSTRHLYRRMFRAQALQGPDEVDVDELALTGYEAVYRRFDRDWPTVPARQKVEVSFAELEASPLGTVERIYDSLGLPDVAAARPAMEAYLESVADYRKNAFTIDETERRVLTERLAPWVERWGD